jgi:hypothetical protein
VSKAALVQAVLVGGTHYVPEKLWPRYRRAFNTGRIQRSYATLCGARVPVTQTLLGQPRQITCRVCLDAAGAMGW